MTKFLLFTMVAFLAPPFLLAQKDSAVIILEHANVIDGIGNKPLMDVSVLIENGKITSIQKQAIKQHKNAVSINLKGKWLLPGYIDAHVHLFEFANAKTALTNGVTTARTMGCNHFFDIEMRNRHKTGGDSLPDIVAAGYQVRPDMPDEFYKDFPEFDELKPRLQGVENIRRVVKALLARGVNVIKVLATERAGTPETDPRKRTFTDEEITALVEEAENAGIPVAAHAHGDDGAYAAVKAGVRSIEHGSYLSDKTLALMKTKGTFYVPTFSFWEQTANNPQSKSNPVLVERIQTFLQLVNDVTERAYKLNVPIAVGTDTRYTMAGLSMGSEAEKLSKAGMPAMNIIKAMTYGSAMCLKIHDRTGAVKKEMEADLIVLEKNPLEDIAALKNILLVINNGRLVVNRLNH